MNRSTLRANCVSAIMSLRYFAPDRCRKLNLFSLADTAVFLPPGTSIPPFSPLRRRCSSRRINHYPSLKELPEGLFAGLLNMVNMWEKIILVGEIPQIFHPKMHMILVYPSYRSSYKIKKMPVLPGTPALSGKEETERPREKGGVAGKCTKRKESGTRMQNRSVFNYTFVLACALR